MSSTIEYKQVIVINRALKMSVGKVAAQAAHAAMTFLVTEDPRESQFSREAYDFDFSCWMEHSGMTKVILRVDSAEHLDNIEQKARDAGLRVRFVMDAGRTTFGGVPTKTCIAIGPNDTKIIDSVTGKLALL